MIASVSADEGWNGSISFVRVGAIVVITGNIYRTTQVAQHGQSVVLARAHFPHTMTPTGLSGLFISYSADCNGTVGTYDGYNLAIMPRNGALPANIYVSLFAIGYTSLR